jgi:hypothetical protein
VPVASIDGPDRYTFGLARGETTARSLVLDAVGDGARARLEPRRRDPPGRPAASPVHRLRRELQGSVPVVGQVPARTRSRTTSSRAARGLAAMLCAGLPIPLRRAQGTGMYDTHADQADELTTALKLTADSLVAFQRDSRGARARRPRRSFMCGRSSGGACARERLGRGPTTCAAGSGC